MENNLTPTKSQRRGAPTSSPDDHGGALPPPGDPPGRTRQRPSFDPNLNGIDGYVFFLGWRLYAYTFWFQHDTLEVLVHGNIVSINIRTLCDALGVKLESRLSRLKSKQGDDIYAPVALPGSPLVAVVLPAVPQLLSLLDTGKMKDRPKLRLYQRHLYPSLWDALPQSLTEGMATQERLSPGVEYFTGDELVQELQMPMAEYHKHWSTWLTDCWPRGLPLPPLLKRRPDAVFRGPACPPQGPPPPIPRAAAPSPVELEASVSPMGAPAEPRTDG